MRRGAPTGQGFWVPPRRHDAEWMDRPDNPPEALHAALADIRRVNRWLGGRAALLHAARPWLAAAPAHRPYDVLDVGTGAGDLARDLVALGRAVDREVRVTAIDRDPLTCRIAREDTGPESGVTVVRADAFAPPFPAAAFDLVTASLFLHHFRPADVVRLLATFRRLARRAVLVNDLRRHRLPWAVILLVAHLTRRHPMFVHDAPLSVLRGFTVAELQAAAVASGAGDARVQRRWPYRLLATIPAVVPP